jgi:hypothetical protein
MKNPHAVKLGRLGGLVGGPARARALSASRRIEIARQAVLARWSRHRTAQLKISSPPRVDMKRLAEDRVYRRNLANRYARDTEVDPGDLEHVLYNLTLPPLERLARGLS